MYASPTFVGYSLWLVPHEPLKEKLLKIISDTATKHSTLSFEPHITLVAGLQLNADQVIASTKKMAEDIKALTLQIDSVVAKDLYFQSVFATVSMTDSLQQLRQRALEVRTWCRGIEPFQDILAG